MPSKRPRRTKRVSIPFDEELPLPKNWFDKCPILIGWLFYFWCSFVSNQGIFHVGRFGPHCHFTRKKPTRIFSKIFTKTWITFQVWGSLVFLKGKKIKIARNLIRTLRNVRIECCQMIPRIFEGYTPLELILELLTFSKCRKIWFQKTHFSLQSFILHYCSCCSLERLRRWG